MNTDRGVLKNFAKFKGKQLCLNSVSFSENFAYIPEADLGLLQHPRWSALS